MKNKPVMIGVGVVLLIVVGILAWWLVAPIFVDRTVDEAFPGEAAGQVAPATVLPTEPAAAPATSTPETEVATAPPEETTEVAAPPTELPPATPTTAATPTPEGPVALALGEFQGGERDYVAIGTATLYQLPDGNHILRFENFEASNGPDLRVLLATNPNPTSSADKGDFVDLGALKGNIGNQNYDIPPEIDLAQYQSVIIYCRAFSAVFGTASLS